MNEEVLKRLRSIVKSAVDSVDPLGLLAMGSVSDVYTDEISKIVWDIQETYTNRYNIEKERIMLLPMSMVSFSEKTTLSNIVFDAFQYHDTDNSSYSDFKQITHLIFDRFFYFFGS